MRVWMRLAALFAAFSFVACGGGSEPGQTVDATNSGGDTKDPSEIGEVDDTVVDNPKLTAKINANVTEGNAPLNVHLACDVTGDEPENLDYLWKIGDQPSSLSELDFTFYVEGDYKTCCTVWRKSGEGESAEDCTLIRVRGSAELSISNPKIDGPSELSQGECTTVSFNVQNNGAQVKSDFELRCVLSQKQDWDVEADSHILLKSMTIAGMDDGQYQTQTTEYDAVEICLPADLEDGTYFLLCKVDAGDIVNEMNKGDNAKFATTFISVDHTLSLRPDLIVTDLGALSDQSFPKSSGDLVTYELKVSNVGEADAEQFVYRVYLCHQDVDHLAADLEQDCMTVSDEVGSKIYGMEVDVTIPIMRNWTVQEGMEDGDYCFVGKVDVNEQVAEDNEDNNLIVSQECIELKYEEKTGIDLHISDLKCSPTDAVWNGTVVAEFTVTNNGNVATPKWDYEVFLSLNPAPTPATSYALCKGNDCKNAASIGPGEQVKVIEVVSVPGELPLTDYWCIVKVDQSGVISETDESNNLQAFTEKISVTSKAYTDVYVSGVTFSPQVQDAGDPIKVTYELGNSNTSTAPGVYVCVVLSTDPSVSASGVATGADIVIGQAIVPSIAPNSSHERTDKVTLPLALDHTIGTYYVGVVADCYNSLPDDTQKGNNASAATSTLTVLNPQGGCFEDSYEPNSAKTQAKVISEGTISDLGYCNDDDWFKVSVPGTYTLTVDMTAHPPLSLDPLKADPSDVDLELWGPNGELIDTSASTGSVDSVNAFMVPQAGDYLVRVKSKKNNTSAQYDLTVSFTPPLDGIDLRPVKVLASPVTTWPGGPLFLTWKLVNLGLTPAGAFDVGVYVSQDETIDESDQLVGTLPFDGASPASITDQESTLLLPADVPGGVVYVGLKVDSGNTVAEENELNNTAVSSPLTIDASTPCIDDDYESNNTPETATPMEVTGSPVTGLGVCPYLDDWYEVDLEKGVNFAAIVTYSYKSTKGYLYVQLLDETGVAVLDEGIKLTNPAVVLPYVWATGKYYVRVYNPIKNGKGAPYTYTLTMGSGTPNAGDVCEPDAFEGNNHWSFANTVGCGLKEMSLCKKDSDWMTFDLPAGSSVTITLTHAQNQLKMSVYKDPEASVVTTLNGNGVKILSAGPTPQTYYLHIGPKFPTVLPTIFDYTLFFDGLSGADLSILAASAVTGEVYQGEDEILGFQVSNQCLDDVPAMPFGFYLSTDSTFDAGDILVHEGVLENVVPGKGTVSAYEKFTVPWDTPAGDYWVYVVADHTEQVVESNELNNFLGAALKVKAICVDDALEPNSSPGWAPEIAAGSFDNLQICAFDFDWYKISLEAGDMITVDIAFENANGDLDLRLYAADNVFQPVKKAFETNDGESLSYTTQEAAYFYVRVNGLSGASNAYTMDLTIDAAVP